MTSAIPPVYHLLHRLHHPYQDPMPEVLDLSRRRDSVETTRKTPSPYTSSSHDENSPSARSYSSHLPPTTPVPSNLSTSHHLLSSPMAAIQNASYYAAQRTPSPSEASLYSQAATSHRRQNDEYDSQKCRTEHDTHTGRDSDDSSEIHSFQPQLSPDHSAYPMMVGRDGKLARPFKAYPRNPMSIAASFTATDAMLDSSSAEKYNLFRKRMLDQIHAANGGQPTVSNPKMRRTTVKASSCSDTESKSDDRDSKVYEHNGGGSSCSGKEDGGNSTKDTAYFERRKKNNAAAKKSRDRRRIKEDEIAIRAAYLERENIELKFELASMRKQLAVCGVPVSP